MLLLLVSGCGLKTALVVYDDATAMPSIPQLSYQKHGTEISINFDVQGGSGLLVYQVDRAEIEAGCKCIEGWLRYYESSPSSQRLALQRHITLKAKQHYAFRLRVVDSLGRKSAWSNIIRTDRKQVGNSHD